MALVFRPCKFYEYFVCAITNNRPCRTKLSKQCNEIRVCLAIGRVFCSCDHSGRHIGFNQPAEVLCTGELAITSLFLMQRLFIQCSFDSIQRTHPLPYVYRIVCAALSLQENSSNAIAFFVCLTSEKPFTIHQHDFFVYSYFEEKLFIVVKRLAE